MEKLKKLFVASIVSIFIFSLGIGIVPKVKAATAEELRAKIAELQAQIARLQKQLEIIEETPTKTWCHNFYKNLRYGDRGPEVYALQEALRKEGFKISKTEHTARISAYFGITTASAVVGFQEKYKEEILVPWGLEYGTGFVGKTTRKKLNELYGCGVVPPLPPTTCFDTDGGKNYYVKGTVSSESGLRTDICGKGNDLIEYYCEGDEIRSVTYNCPNGCQDGACVEKPSITVLYPNGGEKWYEGKEYTIKWKSRGLTSNDKISIEIWRDDNSNALIGTVSGNTTSYTWKVNLSEIKWGKPCFAKGTKVLVKSFERGEEIWPIEKIKPGDYVVSFDLEKREKTFSKVRRVIQRKDPLVIINKTLKAAPDQLIYTNKGFKKAKEIKVGDFLLNQKGELVRVFSTEEDSIKRETFDLILEKEPENFFAEGFLVHSAPSEYKYKISLRVYKKHISDDSDNYFAIVPSLTTCTDTDGGKNYYVKGTVTNRWGSHTDFCDNSFPGYNLREYYCDEKGEIRSKMYNCPNGCQDGACVEKITVIKNVKKQLASISAIVLQLQEKVKKLLKR